jgi:hypothetical protein
MTILRWWIVGGPSLTRQDDGGRLKTEAKKIPSQVRTEVLIEKEMAGETGLEPAASSVTG